MNQELLKYSWEDLAGALLVKSNETTYRESEPIKDEYSIQCILDKVKVLEECLREHRGIALDDLSIDGMPGWFYVHDLILQIEYAITGFASLNEHCDTEYKSVIAQQTALMAMERIAEYGEPVYEFAKKHGIPMDTGPNLIKWILAEFERSQLLIASKMFATKDKFGLPIGETT